MILNPLWLEVMATACSCIKVKKNKRGAMKIFSTSRGATKFYKIPRGATKISRVREGGYEIFLQKFEISSGPPPEILYDRSPRQYEVVKEYSILYLIRYLISETNAHVKTKTLDFL